MYLAVLLACEHHFTPLDIDEERVALVNASQPAVADALTRIHGERTAEPETYDFSCRGLYRHRLCDGRHPY